MENESEKPKRLNFETAKLVAKSMGINVSDAEIIEKVNIARWITDNHDALSIVYAKMCADLNREQSYMDFIAFSETMYKRVDGATLAIGKTGVMPIPKEKQN